MSWLLYRRMYRWFWIAAAVWVGSSLLGILALFVALVHKVQSIALLLTIGLWALPLAFTVAFGIYGTYWYYLHARREISRLTLSGQADLEAVGRVGGTNIEAAVVCAVLLGFLALWGESGSR